MDNYFNLIHNGGSISTHVESSLTYEKLEQMFTDIEATLPKSQLDYILVTHLPLHLKDESYRVHYKDKWYCIIEFGLWIRIKNYIEVPNDPVHWWLYGIPVIEDDELVKEIFEWVCKNIKSK